MDGFAVGLDAVEVARMRSILGAEGADFRGFFTAAERAHCEAAPDPASAFASTFAVKEAAWKATSAWHGSRLPVRAFEVVRDARAPRVLLPAPLKGLHVGVSVSYAAGVAYAVAIAHDITR